VSAAIEQIQDRIRPRLENRIAIRGRCVNEDLTLLFQRRRPERIALPNGDRSRRCLRDERGWEQQSETEAGEDALGLTTEWSGLSDLRSSPNCVYRSFYEAWLASKSTIAGEIIGRWRLSTMARGQSRRFVNTGFLAGRKDCSWRLC
jgi:hypothetical protein